EVYGLDSAGIAFSQQSVQGAMNWLEALHPIVMDDNRFRRRFAVPLYTLLWTVDALYRRAQTAYGVRITLNSDIETQICRACLLEPEALPTSFQVAQSAFDTRRNGMGFGVGT